MAEKGFVKLNRGFFENPFWKEKRTYSNAEAWIDLIQSARFENSPEKILVKMKLIIINRGELRASQRYLAERWNWSVGKVNRFIKVLEMERMVERRMEHSETVIKLCKYDTYNNEGKPVMNTNRHSNGDLNGTATEHRQIQTKESKEREEGKESKEYMSFDSFWDLYDKKVGRDSAEKKWEKIPQSEKEKIMQYIPKYKTAQPDKTYRKNPDTFLNQKAWNDELPNSANQPRQRTKLTMY